MNRKNLTVIFALTLLLLLTSCRTTSSFHYGTVDLEKKSVSLNPGGDNFLGTLKQALLQEGWDLYVNGADYMVTNITPEQQIQYQHYTSRYILRTSYRLYTNFNSNDSLLDYDLSLIDTESKKEVLTYSGAGNIFEPFSVKRVVKGFVEELRKVADN